MENDTAVDEIKGRSSSKIILFSAFSYEMKILLHKISMIHVLYKNMELKKSF